MSSFMREFCGDLGFFIEADSDVLQDFKFWVYVPAQLHKIAITACLKTQLRGQNIFQRFFCTRHFHEDRGASRTMQRYSY